MRKIYIFVVIIIFFIGCSDKKVEKEINPKLEQNSSISQNISILGKWVWEKDSMEHTFNVTIKKENDYYTGSYCAIAQSGEKIDCGLEGEPSFKIENLNTNEFIVVFKTYFSETIGKVKLRFENNKLYWEIIEEPEGEYYCPNIAVLVPSKE